VCKVAAGKDVVRIVSGAGTTFREKDFVTVSPDFSVTWIVQLKAPAPEGAPLKIPDELKEIPGGSAPPVKDQE
jgi:hypothetical protein